MNKAELTTKVSEVLRNNGITKHVNVASYPMYISDDEGNQKKFVVPIPAREVPFNKVDAGHFIDAFFAVLEDCIRRGEELNIYGIITFGLKVQSARMLKIPGSDEYISVPPKMIPYVKFGNMLKTAARLYDAKVKESRIELPPPIYDSCESEDDDI